MATIDTITTYSDLPNQHDMLIPEVAVQLGCDGCAEDVAGVYVATISDRNRRQAFIEDITTGAAVLEVPAEVRISSQVYPVGEAVQNCGSCALSGACGDELRDVIKAYFPRTFI